MRTPKRVVACIAILLLTPACGTVGGEGVATPGTAALTVQVTNQSQQIVNVYFQTESGVRVRVGTVSPSTTDLFFPRIPGMAPGYFLTHRLGAKDRGIRIEGVANPRVIGTGTVHIMVGALPQYDAWSLRG